MAGRLTLSTLNNDTGVLATQNGMNGIAKAWVSFNGTSGSVSIFKSFNVSSITYNGTGDYTANFITAMPDANYTMAGNASYATNNNYHGLFLGGINGVAGSVRTTSACQFSTRFMNGSNPPPNQDCSYIGVAFFN